MFFCCLWDNCIFIQKRTIRLLTVFSGVLLRLQVVVSDWDPERRCLLESDAFTGDYTV